MSDSARAAYALLEEAWAADREGRTDLETVRSLLVDLDSHAEALDATGGARTHRDETAERHRRLAGLDPGGLPGS